MTNETNKTRFIFTGEGDYYTEPPRPLFKVGYETENGETFPVYAAFRGSQAGDYVTYDPDGYPGQLCPCSLGGRWGR